MRIKARKTLRDGIRSHDNHLMLKTEQLDAPKILQSSECNRANRVIVSAFSSVQHLETTYQSLAPTLHTTPWSVNEILITTVVDANRELKIKLWIQSFSKQTMQITELFLKPLDTEFRFNESSSLWALTKRKLSPHYFPSHVVLLTQWQGKNWSQLAHDLLGKIPAPK